MGYPTFIWYPDGGSIYSSREDTAFAEEISDLQINPARSRVMSTSAGGRHSSTVLSAAMQTVRIVVENFTGDAPVRSLLAMEAHLEKGGAVGFTRDPAKSWAGYATGSLARGDTALATTGDVWFYAGTAVLAAGDVVCVEGSGPEGNREYTVVQSVSGTTVNVSPALKYTYSDSDVMIRWMDYYPVLVSPPFDRTIMTHDRRLNWTFDVLLETDPDVAAILNDYESGGGVLRGPTVGVGSLTLDDLQDRVIGVDDAREKIRDEGGYALG